MRIEPAGDGREYRGDDEHRQPGSPAVDAHAFRHQSTGLQRAQCPAFSRVQEVPAQHEQDQEHRGRQDERLAAGEDVAAERQWRNMADALEVAEPVQRAEQGGEGQAPGQRAEWQIMPGEAHRDRAGEECRRCRQRDCQRQGLPGRQAEARGTDGGRVGGDADEAGLAERGEAGDAAEQHQTEGDHGRQKDLGGHVDLVIIQRLTGEQGRDGDRGEGRPTGHVTPPRRGGAARIGLGTG
jgi:hypothetical protein